MKNLLTIFFAAIMLLPACSKKNTPASSSSSVPATSFSADVMPILQAHCTPCHFPSKGGKVASLETIENFRSNYDNSLMRVQLDSTDKRFMPFRNKKPALSAAQIDVLKNWGKNNFSK